jgi:diaminopimelate epimerase
MKLACGTGAIASVLIAAAHGLVDSPVAWRQPGDLEYPLA